jgi:hypothetical protein
VELDASSGKVAEFHALRALFNFVLLFLTTARFPLFDMRDEAGGATD